MRITELKLITIDNREKLNHLILDKTIHFCLNVAEEKERPKRGGGAITLRDYATANGKYLCFVNVIKIIVFLFHSGHKV